MFAQRQAQCGSPVGLGLGLRWAFLECALEQPLPDALAFFEVSPENYMRRGGYFPETLTRVAQRRPILTHGLMLNVGSTDPLDHGYLAQLRAFLRELSVTRHTDHLCWTGSHERLLHDLLPLPSDAGTARHVADRIRRVQDAIGMPIALENISYYALPGTRPDDREFVNEVLDRADCGLLLDINNVYCNAVNHGFDARAYIEALPLERVVRLHVAGGERLPDMDGLVIDTHGTDVPPPVRALMAWAVTRIGPIPVLYERDHTIPPFPELLRELAELDVIYQDAVAEHTCSMTAASSRGAGDHGDDVHSPRALQHAFSRMILDIDTFSPTDDPIGFFRDHGAEQEVANIASIGAARLLVYRTLVRRGVFGAVQSFLPRTCARLGDHMFERELAIWLERVGPRSPYLRDVPSEFVSWIEHEWLTRADIPAYLNDLARHEIVEAEVAASATHSLTCAPGLQLDAAAVFDPSVRIVRYRHAVHELPDVVTDRTVPRTDPVTLLVYRDPEHQVRWLELSAIGEHLLEPLLAGQPLRHVIESAAAHMGTQLDDALLERVAVLLADLGERKVLLGSTP